jgi:copper(I)-binding protein
MTEPGPSRRARAGALALLALLAAFGHSTPALARPHRAAGIRVSDAWTPAPPPGAPTAAGYLTITNTASSPDRLLGGSTPAAAQVQLHSMSTQGGVMRMRPLAEGLPIAPGSTVKIQPGGNHLMLVGLKRSLRVGEHIPVTLDFAKAGKVQTDFVVRPQGAAQTPMQMGPYGQMDRMHMGAGR